MNITTAIIIILCFILAYILIIEFYTVIFQASGLTREKARYQALSLFTNCGFTTGESELITSDRHRRKLAISLMVIGHVFSVVIVSLVVSVLGEFKASNLKSEIRIISILVGSFILILLIFKLPFIKTPLIKLLEKIATNRALKKRKDNILTLLDNYGKQSLVEIYLYWVPEILKDKSLAEANLKRNYDLNLVAIKRKNKVLNVTAHTIIQPMDKIIVFGHIAIIDDIFMDPVDRHAKEELSSKNVISILDNYGKDALCEVIINDLPEIFENTTLSTCGIKEKYNISVMMVQHETSQETAGRDTVISKNDTVVVFGPYDNIKALFRTIEE